MERLGRELACNALRPASPEPSEDLCCTPDLFCWNMHVLLDQFDEDLKKDMVFAETVPPIYIRVNTHILKKVILSNFNLNSCPTEHHTHHIIYANICDLLKAQMPHLTSKQLKTALHSYIGMELTENSLVRNVACHFKAWQLEYK